MDYQITVNGTSRTVSATSDTPLLYVLMNQLDLKGPRFGCGLAQCGSCSVLLDGVEIRSCITPVAAVQGKALTTLEGLPALYAQQKGLAQAPAMHPLQQAFIDHDAFQCGYCTPGQICSAVAVLGEIEAGIPSHVSADLTARPQATAAEFRERMSGNICRCGAYSNIVDAIVEVAGSRA